MGANKVDRKEQMLGYLFIVPAVVYMLIFIGYPIIYNWIVSFQDVTAMTLGSDAWDLPITGRYLLMQHLGRLWCILLYTR